MTVDQTTTIDLIAETKDGDILLVMIEDRRWDASDVAELEAKLNTYLHFVIDGALHERVPNSGGKKIFIQLDCVERPTNEIISYLNSVVPVLRKFKLEFLVNILPESH